MLADTWGSYYGLGFVLIFMGLYAIAGAAFDYRGFFASSLVDYLIRKLGRTGVKANAFFFGVLMVAMGAASFLTYTLV